MKPDNPPDRPPAWSLRSKWWKPQPLGALSQLSDEDVKRLEETYRRWQEAPPRRKRLYVP